MSTTALAHMENGGGREKIVRLGGKDLNKDGRIINLVVVGSSRFYDYSVVEEALDKWVGDEANPDLIITGGASRNESQHMECPVPSHLNDDFGRFTRW